MAKRMALIDVDRLSGRGCGLNKHRAVFIVSLLRPLGRLGVVSVAFYRLRAYSRAMD
jgi:hypothetical protein